MLKRCGSCKEEKPKNKFHKDRTTKDGRSWTCKECKYVLYVQYYKRKLRSEKRRFPYGEGDVLHNSKYLSDRSEMFREHGNGWWWGLDRDLGARYPSGRPKPIKQIKKG
jgi:hypothetical protein